MDGQRVVKPQSLPPNQFKRALAAGRVQLGLWLTLDCVTSTEIVAGSGYDWLLLDMEHTCIEPSRVIQHILAARGGSAELVVRVPQLDAVLLKRLMDAGVRSFMFPQINSVQQAREAVAATRYPPHGIRGVAGNMRANNFSRVADYFERYQDEVCIILQLETQAALDGIESMAAIDGVDGLFIGPNDLAASLGMLGKPADPVVKHAIADGVIRIGLAGKAAGILNFVPAEARALLKSGVCFVAIASDAGLLARRSESLLEEFEPR